MSKARKWRYVNDGQFRESVRDKGYWITQYEVQGWSYVSYWTKDRKGRVREVAYATTAPSQDTLYRVEMEADA